MKRSDVASLLLIVSISFSLAYFLGNALFNTPESRSTTVEVVTAVGAELDEPDITIFNKDAINPTQDIKINQSGIRII